MRACGQDDDSQWPVDFPWSQVFTRFQHLHCYQEAQVFVSEPCDIDPTKEFLYGSRLTRLSLYSWVTGLGSSLTRADTGSHKDEQGGGNPGPSCS